MDWKKLKDEYINTAISYQKLAEKYNVSFWALASRGKKEKWFDQKVVTYSGNKDNPGNGVNHNMIPINSLPKEEQKKLRKKAAEKRKENFEKRLNSKECAQLILDLDLKDEKARTLLKKMGISEKNLQNRMLMIFSLFQNGVKYGDTGRIRTLLEIAGELDQQEQKDPVISINVQAATEDDL